MDMEKLIRFGRSWAYSPSLKISGANADSEGYDMSRRCYRITKKGDGHLRFSISAGKTKPLINPAIHIRNWGGSDAVLNVNGKHCKDCEISLLRTLEGVDLLIFLWMDTEKPVEVSVLPE